MDEPDNNLPQAAANKIVFGYACIAALTYIVFFLIMKMAGYIDHTNLRFVNYGLFAIVGFFALHKAKAIMNGHMGYLQGMGIAFMTGAVSFILLALFITAFIQINPAFSEVVVNATPGTMNYSLFTTGVVIASEGITFSVIIALCLMQYFKMP